MSSDVINIDRVLASFDELWAPRVLATVNDWAVKLAKVVGEHVWHAHPETDEVFIVLSGHLDIHWRNASHEVQLVRLGPRDVHVVPRGVEHRPSSAAGAVLMLVEPAATLSTGDFAGPLPSHVAATTGFETG
ncbi:cupin domain-containing protein [Pseudonocardia alni]|uniref:cupin domain-containing protein n=1 Tax=Pseudonocardia alni TaxID=33907 RepID=UPI002478CFDA|nr:cupin domain-containing protein [Pseudonocardia alni]WFG47223.1 cupin domain-containing protein [Pseudonocardia alni]